MSWVPLAEPLLVDWQEAIMMAKMARMPALIVLRVFVFILVDLFFVLLCCVVVSSERPPGRPKFIMRESLIRSPFIPNRVAALLESLPHDCNQPRRTVLLGNEASGPGRTGQPLHALYVENGGGYHRERGVVCTDGSD